jgi:smad nuclear-interacting protein 1
LAFTNGTFLNDEPVEPSKYIELLHKDVQWFGFSDRHYVLAKDEEAKQPARAY